MLKPPIERELFVNNKVVLEAVVSGDELETVKQASVSCKVKNKPVTSVAGNINFPEGASQFIRTHYIFVDTEKWFNSEMVTCSIHDRGINRDIKQEISFDKGGESFQLINCVALCAFMDDEGLDMIFLYGKKAHLKCLDTLSKAGLLNSCYSILFDTYI